jgi:hypothetical protein
VHGQLHIIDAMAFLVGVAFVILETRLSPIPIIRAVALGLVALIVFRSAAT